MIVCLICREYYFDLIFLSRVGGGPYTGQRPISSYTQIFLSEVVGVSYTALCPISGFSSLKQWVCLTRHGVLYANFPFSSRGHVLYSVAFYMQISPLKQGACLIRRSVLQTDFPLSSGCILYCGEIWDVDDLPTDTDHILPEKQSR